MDVAVIGLAAHSDPIEDATRELDKFTGASKRADAANDERTASSRRVATADNAATVASRANTAALQAQAAAARMAAFRQRNLMFQLNDIGVSLVSGMNPLMVLAQQGTQITQIYGGQGGASAALADTASMALRLSRVAGPIALLGLAFAGLQNDIQDTQGVAVSFGNVFTALMLETAASVMNVAGPAVERLGYAFNRTAEIIFGTLQLIGDSVINVFTWAIRSVVALWGGLPGAMADIGVRAAEGLINQIRYMAREVVTSWNELMNSLGLQQFMTDAPASIFPDIELPNANRGAADALMASLGAAYDDTFANSPFGAFFERVGERAAALATSITEVGTAAQAAGQPMDLLGNSVQAANDNFEAGRGIFSSFFSDLSGQIQQGASVWDAFKTAGLNALNSLLDKVMEMATNNLFMSLFGNGTTSSGGLGSLFGGLFGGSSSGSGIGFGPGTSLPLYEQGTNYVPNTGPAILHKGEAVVPAKYNTAGGASGGVSVIRVELSGDVQATMVDTAANVSVQVVKASSPGIVNQSVASTGGALKSGQMDGPMAKRYGLGKTARAR